MNFTIATNDALFLNNISELEALQDPAWAQPWLTLQENVLNTCVHTN